MSTTRAVGQSSRRRPRDGSGDAIGMVLSQDGMVLSQEPLPTPA
jgi:hypothetical protein